MGGTAQAGIEGTDHSLDAVQNAVGELAILDVVGCGLGNAAVHGVVVLPGGDHQVGPDDFAVVVNLVVVVQGAAWSFGLACTFEPVDAGLGADMGVENRRVGENGFDLLDAVEDVD